VGGCTNPEIRWASFRIVGMCQLVKVALTDSEMTVSKTDMYTCEMAQLYF
jgi:hypothetical protein